MFLTGVICVHYVDPVHAGTWQGAGGPRRLLQHTLSPHHPHPNPHPFLSLQPQILPEPDPPEHLRHEPRSLSVEPEFVKPIPNLSVVTGKEAFMKCLVKNLGNYKVSWKHVDKQAWVAIQDHVITPNPRIKVKQDHQTWSLIIHNVSLEDKGYYMCQISCQPPKSQVGYLDVVVPPYFEDSAFSVRSGSNITIREYENVTLSCKANGNPKPRIKWRREDGQAVAGIAASSSSSSSSGSSSSASISALRASSGYHTLNDPDVVFADELFLREATRWATGAYLCVASNGIAPSISRRIMIIVQFPPMIRIPAQVITSSVGQNVTLECITESNPLAQHEWLDPFENQILSDENSFKYHVRVQKTYYFKVIYTLTIFAVDYSDSGRYVCLVKNSLGVTRSGLTLQVVDKTSSTQTTFAPTFPLLPSSPGNNNSPNSGSGAGGGSGTGVGGSGGHNSLFQTPVPHKNGGQSQSNWKSKKESKSRANGSRDRSLSPHPLLECSCFLTIIYLFTYR